MNMIEKVARAIREINTPDTMEFTFDNLDECSKDSYRTAAKAAIVAMREPTEEMSCDRRMVDVAVYIDMIDAALKE